MGILTVDWPNLVGLTGGQVWPHRFHSLPALLTRPKVKGPTSCFCGLQLVCSNPIVGWSRTGMKVSPPFSCCMVLFDFVK